MLLLSRFVANSIVEILRSKKESCSTRETYAWAPILGVFDKLREVGVSPYLGFILYLSTLLMFELNAVKVCLIGPKSWDRIVIIFETQMVQPVTVHG